MAPTPPAEQGGPQPRGEHAAERRGYGRELIERALPYALGAQTTFGLAPGGVHCAIILPLADSNG